MLKPRFGVCIFSVGMMVLGGGVVFAQNFPNKPIQIFTAEPGAGLDFAARLIAQVLSCNLGQQVIVVNRGAAGGAAAAQTVAKAPPDGYTLLYYGSGIWLGPFLRSNVLYDPVKDLAPVTLASTAPMILVVHPSLPVKSVKELIALAKARPGQLDYGSGGAGSPTHLSAELFKAAARIDIARVPYRSAGPALNALIGGQLHLMFATAASAAPHVKSRRLTALAVTTAQPSALAPGLPTVAASGLPGYESASIVGVFAPARTPGGIVNRLNQEIVRALSQPEIKGKFLSSGVETVGSTPEEFGAKVKAEMARLGKLIKDAGIREE